MRWTGPQKFKSFQCKKIECDALFAEVETRVGPTSSICHRSPIDGDDLADFGIEWWQFHLVWPVSCHRGIISEKRTYFLMFFNGLAKKRTWGLKKNIQKMLRTSHNFYCTIWQSCEWFSRIFLAISWKV